MNKSNLLAAAGIVVIIVMASFLAYHFAFEATSPPSPSVDGSSSSFCITSLTCSTSLSTSKSGDLIYVVLAVRPAGSGFSPSNYKCTDTSSLSYSLRKSFVDANGHNIATMYAISSTALSSDKITCSYSASSTQNFTVAAIGISGYSSSAPFDPNSAVPSTASSGTTDSTTGSATISTSNANDLLLGVFNIDGSQTSLTAGSGFSTVLTVMNGRPPNMLIESKSVSSTQSGDSISASWSTSAGWAEIADAIQGGSSGTSTSSTTSSGNSTSTTSVTSQSNSSAVQGQSTQSGHSIIQNPMLLTEYALAAVIVILFGTIIYIAVRKR
jgi:hypothetical protein